MSSLIRLALMALLVAGSVAMAFANPTVTDTVGTAYSATDGVLMIDLIGKDTVVLHRASTTDQTEAGARAVTTVSTGYADGGYLRYTAHGFTKLLKILVSSSTAGLVPYAVVTRVQSFHTDGSAEASLGHIDTFFRPLSSTSQELVHDISGTDTYTGTNAASGLWLEYWATENPGVSSLAVVYTIMEQS
ncbi:MAG: hypothetical protein WCL50_00190 [Spirochaetota bacterium]